MLPPIACLSGEVCAPYIASCTLVLVICLSNITSQPVPVSMKHIKMPGPISINDEKTEHIFGDAEHLPKQALYNLKYFEEHCIHTIPHIHLMADQSVVELDVPAPLLSELKEVFGCFVLGTVLSAVCVLLHI